MTAIDRYVDNLTALLARVREEQADALEQAALRVARCLREGGMVYTFGTGHGHLLALELFYRAGGMARVCPILDERLMLHVSASESTAWERTEGFADGLLSRYPVGAGDVLIAISNSGRNAAPVELAMSARARGAYVIALTNLRHTKSVSPRNALGKRLFEAADLVLDNGGVPGDAAISARDGSMTGPTSTAVGAAMLQAIVCRVREICEERGWAAEFFVSSNVDGGDDANRALIARYKGSIQGL